MKRCYKCGNVKPRTEFNKDSSKHDGLHGRCKACATAYKRARRLANPEKTRAERKAYRDRHPERNRHDGQRQQSARAAVMRAVRSGEMERGPCEICGAGHAQAHHEDYSRKLDVVWLCPVHHQALHHGHYSLL